MTKSNYFKGLTLIMLLILFLGTGAIYFYRVKAPICPDDFKTAEESTAAFIIWENNFYKNNPNALLADMGNARKDFYIQNNCTEALKRYNGNVDTETKTVVDTTLNEYRKP
jgi:hypothetical protein